MYVNVGSVAFVGLDVTRVDVEVSLESRGLPCFDIVGLPAKSIAESKHRLRMSFANLGLDFPTRKRVVVNLAPADLHKNGSFYDLAIATGILCAQYELSIPGKSLFFGEVSLDGHLRYVSGAFLLASFAKEMGYTNIFVPKECVQEASCVSGLSVFSLNDLMELCSYLRGKAVLNPATSKKEVLAGAPGTSPVGGECLYDSVLGQPGAKRALQICAAGRHNLILMGPPGAGKSMLAKSLRYIMPPLTEQEAIEVTRIYSAVGKIPPNKAFVTDRPYRSPHHTISYVGLVGGGSTPVPGEITLAHNGVLFLDEINEFPRSVLESLRQPLEDGAISVVRNKRTFTFPANFVLISACNPCPCGYLGHPTKKCTCTERMVANYKSRLSGPLLDRIDLHVPVSPVEVVQLRDVAADQVAPGISSKEVRETVLAAYGIQRARFSGSDCLSNSRMTNNQVREHCVLGRSGQLLMERAYAKFSLSARAYFRLLKVARTIADLDGCESILDVHLTEALQYRVKLG